MSPATNFNSYIKGRDHLGDLVGNPCIILEYIVECLECDGLDWFKLAHSSVCWFMACACEYRDEPAGFTQVMVWLAERQ